ncbi:pilus assembly protein [Acidaminobacter sp. JC074]|uniref:TadE family protein n=1 Tax=Acidaminobacter sp. JC074 TaxID=2530199 RepID=UPI001F0EF2F3|nr:pilus assembly protein [Acidaminobacter sp. JC074]MCH4889034.1 pilus assembly protein [Acidaminobacter sp. JC074]
MNRGSVSVEAAIVFPITILIMVMLVQVIAFFPSEDLKVQQVNDALIRLDSLNYVYEKVGLLTFDLPENPYSDFISSSQSFLNDHMASEILEAYLKNELSNHEILLEDFSVTGDTVSGLVSWNKAFVFGLKKESHVKFEHVLWLFGDDKSLYPNETLTKTLFKNEEEEKTVMVYKTKSGSKYHRAGCFYLVRSTTDKSKIVKVSLYDAKRKYLLSPCERCVKEGK